LDNLGRKIRQLRIVRNLTQKQLADLVGLDESMISKIENGYTIGSVHTLTKFAAVFSVSVTELISGRPKANGGK